MASISKTIFTNMRKQKKYQQGISLYVVIVLVLLSMLLALWASRTSLLNELIVGNDADYQRAYEAAQAMLEDAQNDLVISATTDKRGTDGKTIFPDDNGSTFDNYIESTLEPLSNQCINATCKCKHAICAKRTGAQDFWSKSTDFDSMTATNVAARYGEFTGASAGANSNSILGYTEAGRGAWYWIEVMKFSPTPTVSPQLVTNITAVNPVNAKLIYRITAIARGLKPSTQVILQSTIAFPSITGE